MLNKEPAQREKAVWKETVANSHLGGAGNSQPPWEVDFLQTSYRVAELFRFESSFVSNNHL